LRVAAGVARWRHPFARYTSSCAGHAAEREVCWPSPGQTMLRHRLDTLSEGLGFFLIAVFFLGMPTWAGFFVQSAIRDNWFPRRENPLAVAAIKQINSECETYVQLQVVNRVRYELCQRIWRHAEGCLEGEIPRHGVEYAHDDSRYGCTTRQQHKFLTSLGISVPEPLLPETPLPNWLRLAIWVPIGIVQLGLILWIPVQAIQERRHALKNTGRRT
jgi:hypothetical protein